MFARKHQGADVPGLTLDRILEQFVQRCYAETFYAEVDLPDAVVNLMKLGSLFGRLVVKPLVGAFFVEVVRASRLRLEHGPRITESRRSVG